MPSMADTMSEFKSKKLHSGSKKGPKVKSRKQAVAIGLAQERKQGADVPAVPKKKKKTGSKFVSGGMKYQ